MLTLSRRAWWWISGVYAVLLLVVSVIPTPEGPSVPHLDKAVHLCEYFLFAWLLVQIVRAPGLVGTHYLVLAWLYATSYGVLIELIQMMVPWRSGEVMDAVMNGLGAAIGVWVAQRSTPVRR